MSNLSDRLSQLSPAKRALLEKALLEKTNRAQESQRIPRRAEPGPAPLSFAQQRLWFIDQLESGTAAYNIPFAVRLSGRLRIDVLQRSMDEIMRRHETLRTTIALVDGQPSQLVHAPAPVVLPIVDLHTFSPSEREARMQQLMTEEARRPFDIAQGPLLRASLLQLEEQDYVLLLTMHHIISDAWSVGVFMHELATLYRSFVSDQPALLPELPIQYADFAVWQRAWLQGETLEAQLAYWRHHLAGAPAVLALPTDYPRPQVQTFRGTTELLSLSPRLAKALTDLCHQEDVTLFMVLLAAFQLLLARYSGQHDILVGSPIAGRTRRELEGLIGFFVNTLVLRTDLSGNPTVRELLQRVRETCLGAYAHQHVPFEQIVEAVQPERHLSHQPLVQVMFALQNAPAGHETLAELTLTPLPITSGTAKFDLTLIMAEVEGSLHGQLEYNTDLFSNATIRRLLSHFQTLLEQLVAAPSQRIADLVLMPAAERYQLVVEWNATTTAYPREASIPELFARQVARTPDAIATVFDGQELTYRELDMYANQLAQLLRAQGVGPETRVGICVERSSALIVGLLAILKAGGAYVPLDPAYPADRLAYMLHDAQIAVLLTQQHLRVAIPDTRLPVIGLDSDWSQITQQPVEAPQIVSLPLQTAYVMYTSGSTGKPKGIAIPQRAITRLVLNTDYVQLTPEDRVAQASNASFDAATFEIWGALLNGARLIGMPRDVVLSPDEFAAQLRERQINTLFLTTALFNKLASTVPGIFATLRHLLFGGEAVDPGIVRGVLANGAPQRLLHVYGPTESTTFATWQLVEAVPKDAATVPIGRPIANTTMYVLDKRMQPVPVGVPGELYLGGDGLAHGYLNQPALTAERFVPDPCGPEAGARLYKTGDLVRQRADGAIEFVGRIDQQVKIRGFRIELGEIEAQLLKHESIREAVVVAREDLPGNKRLVAYVVPSAPQSLTSDLRAFLAEQLPDYMIPAAFVELESLPLTANGKVDRRALPTPDQQRPDLAGDFAAPQTAVEETLAAIWAQVLGIEQVGIHDNFFALGGDSILSIQIVARANELGMHLTPKHIFQYQTVAELAAVVGTASEIQAEQGLVSGPMLLTPVQRWFFEQEQPEPHHFNQALLLEVRRPLDTALLEQALQRLLEHHDALRARFTQAESGWQQVITSAEEHTIVSLVELESLSPHAQGEAIEQTAADVQTQLDLANGPLVRAVHFRLGPEQPERLLIVIHHLVVDGVSWRILLTDLQAAYLQLSQGVAVQLPRKTTSFQQWAMRLHAYAQSHELRAELEYWKIATHVQVRALPRDKFGGTNDIASTQTVVVALSTDETRALLQEAPKAYNTQINDILLTALALAFNRWTGTQALIVDMEGHGREDLFPDIDLSRTVGWFTTIFPLVIELGMNADLGASLKAVKEQLRAVPQHGIGYGLLRYLSDDRAVVEQLRSLPRAEVSFNYLGQFDQSLGDAELFVPAHESSGPASSPRSRRAHLIDIDGSVVMGQLQMGWTYSTNIHRHDTVERLANDFLDALRRLISHCQASDAVSFTPSDFPQMDFSQEELDDLIAELG